MKWVVANWKDNKTYAAAAAWVKLVGPKVKQNDQLKVVVCPTFLLITQLKQLIETSHYPLLLGAQDLSKLPKGAYTGEVAAELLTGLVDLAILGHSERRQNLAENDKVISQKVEQALAANIKPLVCVQGEETPIPQNVNLVAYEPIFAVGTGNPDTPENADQVATSLKQKYQSGPLSVLYGGSVTSQNIKSFLNQPNLSGVLVGKACLEAEEFCNIIEQSQSV